MTVSWAEVGSLPPPASVSSNDASGKQDVSDNDAQQGKDDEDSGGSQDSEVETEEQDPQNEGDSDEAKKAKVEGDTEIGEIKVEEEELAGVYSPEPTPKVIIKPEELERSALEDLTGLSRKSTFNIQEFFGGNALSLLGLNPKFTLILIDGRRVAGRIDEKIDASQIPLLGVERIEVIRGPLATLYGTGAVAGVVNIITRKPKNKLELSQISRGGSNGFNSQTLELGGKAKSFDYFFAYRRAQRSSFDLNNLNAETDGDAYLNHYFKARLLARVSGNSEISLNGGFFDESNHNVQTTFGGLSRRGEFDTERLDASLAINRKLSSRSELTFTHGVSSYGHSVRTFLVNIDPNNLTEDRFRDEISDTELAYKTYGEEFFLQIGAVRSKEHINSPRILVTRASYWLNSFFVNYENFISSDTSLSLGIRLDEHQSFGSEFSPKVSYWRRSGDFDMRIGYGRGFRAPSLKELYFEFNSPFGYTVRGNPLLTPETVDSFYAAGSYTRGRKFFADLSLFYADVNGMIIPTEVSDSPLVFKEINVANAKSKGATLTVSYKPSEVVTFSLDQTYTVAKDEDTGNLLPQNPRYRGILSVLWKFSPTYELELVNTLVSPQYTSIENTRLAPGYTTLDLNLVKKTGRGKWMFNVRNLTDRVNRRYAPKPGREFFISYEANL